MLKRALLPVYTAGHFTELIRVAGLLKESGAWTPTFWFWRGYYGDIVRHLERCRADGIHAIAESGISPEDHLRTDSPAHAASPTIRARVARLARAASLDAPFPVTALRAFARQRLEFSRCRRLVAEERPDLLILAEDTVGYETAALIKAAHERRVPSVVLPFTVCNALEPAEAYFRDPAYSVTRWDNRLVARMFPRWVYTHRGTTMVRLPAAQLLAKEFLGLAPPRPWQMNSGAADRILVESRFMEAYYRREGLPAEQLVVTGAIAGDVLAEAKRDAVARRSSLRRELGLTADRPIVLCALPPDQFEIYRGQADVEDYATLVRVWLQTLAAVKDWDVIVCLHPRADYQAIRYVEDWGVKISQRDTVTLIPLCTVFVAATSATIRWAIACGIPVLNYDVYRVGWTDFDSATGVVRVDTREAFAAALRRLTGDAQYFADQQARQQRDAPQWGRLDGGNGVGILRCFDELVAANASGRSAASTASTGEPQA